MAMHHALYLLQIAFLANTLSLAITIFFIIKRLRLAMTNLRYYNSDLCTILFLTHFWEVIKN
jgi:hypothetical protein